MGEKNKWRHKNQTTDLAVPPQSHTNRYKIALLCLPSPQPVQTVFVDAVPSEEIYVPLSHVLSTLQLPWLVCV